MQECLYKRGARVPLLMAVDRYVYFTAPLHVSNFKFEFAVRTATKLVSLFSLGGSNRGEHSSETQSEANSR